MSRTFFVKFYIFSKKGVKQQKKAPRLGRPGVLAAAIGVAAAAVLVAAAAEQNQQDDDPAQIAAAEAVIAKVTHNTYLHFSMRLLAAHPIL